MLRPATPEDTPAVITLTIASGLFPPDEVESLREVLDGFHAGQTGADHRLDTVDAPPVGVVYFGPDAMTDRKWYLWMQGYAEVARIPDFYTDRDSKVVYAKQITEKVCGEGSGRRLTGCS